VIGERIRELRKRKKLTLRELAADLGIPFTTLGNYERGDRQPDFGFVLDVANYFGVSMDYLTRGDDVIDYDEHKVKSYARDVEEMLSKADPIVREQILDLHDHLFLITCQHALSNKNDKELVLLNQIFLSISKMKNGFGLGVQKGGFQPITKYELSKLYLKEKQEIDKYFNDLFEIYIERS
jgi:transcriptional regulator with XRE-family HTH domain